MSVLQHLGAVVVELLREDPRRLLLGEDVADGGMLGLSRLAYADELLRPRILTTPLVPHAFVGHVAGLALAGWHPLALLPSTSALIEGMAALRDVSRVPWSSGDERRMPALFVAPFGPGFGLGSDCDQSVDAQLASIAGIRLFCAGSAREAGAWLRTSADAAVETGPTVLLLPRSLLLQELDPGEAMSVLTRDVGRPATIRTGPQVTVFAWGAAVEPAVAACEHGGIEATVVDIGCLAPLDRSALLEAARATGKIVIVHAGPRSHGLGAELAALFADQAILTLDAPVLRVTGQDGPLAPREEHLALPEVAHIAAAIEHVATY